MTKCTIVLVQVDSHPDRQRMLRLRGQEVYSILNLALMGHVKTGRLYIWLCNVPSRTHKLQVDRSETCWNCVLLCYVLTELSFFFLFFLSDLVNVSVLALFSNFPQSGCCR